MSGLAASPTALRQVALAGGDLDETLDFWRDVLGLETYARFDPPGIAFIMIGAVRLFFAAGTPPATIPVVAAAGEAEWMAFLKDPAGNTIGLVARKPA